MNNDTDARKLLQDARRLLLRVQAWWRTEPMSLDDLQSDIDTYLAQPVAQEPPPTSMDYGNYIEEYAAAQDDGLIDMGNVASRGRGDCTENVAGGSGESPERQPTGPRVIDRQDDPACPPAAQDGPPAFHYDRSVPPIVLPPGGQLPANHADDGVRFCPHCNPCTHDGGEKCRAPEHGRDLDARISEIMRAALSGYKDKYRTAEGFTRWGLVEQDIRAACHDAIAALREWDIREHFKSMREAGLEGTSHEDGWTLMTTKCADAMADELAALRTDTSVAQEQVRHLERRIRDLTEEKNCARLNAAVQRARAEAVLEGQRSLMDQTVRIRRAALGLLNGQPDENSEGRDTEEIVLELRARAERAEAVLQKLRTEYFIAGGEMTNTEACRLIDAAIRARTQGGDDVADR